MDCKTFNDRWIRKKLKVQKKFKGFEFISIQNIKKMDGKNVNDRWIRKKLKVQNKFKSFEFISIQNIK